MTRLRNALRWRERAEPYAIEWFDTLGLGREDVNGDSRAYSVAGWDGIAWRVIGAEIEPDEDTEWTGYERATGRVTAAMIGDDAVFAFDPADVSPISDLDYCSSCGQIGCTADGRDRSPEDDATDSGADGAESVGRIEQ